MITNVSSNWILSIPPETVEVAWLLLEDEEGYMCTVLGVYVNDNSIEGWHISGDWKGESYMDAITLPIVAWQPYEIPKAR